MTSAQVRELSREEGIREVTQPVVSRYLAGELSLDAAARRVAAILNAALNWKVQHLHALEGCQSRRLPTFGRRHLIRWRTEEDDAPIKRSPCFDPSHDSRQ